MFEDNKPSRHRGLLKSTNEPCVLIWKHLPDTKDFTVVVVLDQLPEPVKNAIEIVLIQEGNTVHNFADVLSTRNIPGVSVDMLNALHSAGHLRRVNVDDVLMTPTPQQSIPLRDVIAMTETPNEVQPSSQNVTQNVTQNINESANIPQNDPPILQQPFHMPGSTDEKFQTARNLLILADEIEKDAIKKREEAYILCPELRPVAEVKKPETKTTAVRNTRRTTTTPKKSTSIKKK